MCSHPTWQPGIPIPSGMLIMLSLTASRALGDSANEILSCSSLRRHRRSPFASQEAGKSRKGHAALYSALQSGDTAKQIAAGNPLQLLHAQHRFASLLTDTTYALKPGSTAHQRLYRDPLWVLNNG
jgi:hypothetical protein